MILAEDSLTVVEGGRELTYRFDDLMRYHGFGFAGGVAHAFKAMQLAFPILSPEGPPERREISVRTAFQGTGGRDAFEMVTRCFTEGRYVVDGALEQPERGETLKRYVYVLGYRGRSISLHVAKGVVRDEFIQLTRKANRTAEEIALTQQMREEMVGRLLAMPADQAYAIY